MVPSTRRRVGLAIHGTGRSVRMHTWFVCAQGCYAPGSFMRAASSAARAAAGSSFHQSTAISLRKVRVSIAQTSANIGALLGVVVASKNLPSRAVVVQPGCRPPLARGYSTRRAARQR